MLKPTIQRLASDGVDFWKIAFQENWSKNHKKRAELKAEAVEEFGLNFYYEDEEMTRLWLHNICKYTRILNPTSSLVYGHAKEKY